MKKVLPLLGMFAALVAAFDTSAQQLPRARMNSIFPAGGQQGSRIDVTITGGDLDDSNALLFSHKGITAAQKKDDKGNVVANQYTITIAKDVPVGIFDVQVGGGLFGISNVRAFAVGDLPEEQSTGGSSVEKAMEIKLGTTINGQASARNYSYFKVALKKGQRVLVNCQANELDSKMAPVLILKDASGLELERNRFGELLDFTPTSDGDFYVAMHDFTYGGGAEHVFRLTISQRPHIDFIIPPVGKPGSNGKYTVYGRNLPGGQDAGMELGGKPLQKTTVTIALPGDAAARLNISSSMPVGPVAAGFDGIDYRLPSPAGASNPVRIHFADSTVIAEAATDNNKPEAAQKISVPCEYVGQFFPQRDRDWVTFDAKKDDTYWVEVISERLGAPTNPFFRIQRVTKDDKGVEKVSTVKEVQDTPVNIGGATFNTTTSDPSFRFVAPDDGTYRILLYDLYSRGSADSLYRLSIHKEAPDFRIVAMPEGALAIANQPVPMPTGFLRRGQVLPIKVMAFKRDNFNEPIELAIAGLPATITASKAVIPAGQNNAYLMLKAKADAPNWVGKITITGKSMIADKPVIRTARNAAVSTIAYDSTTKLSKVRARLTNTLQLQVTAEDTIPVALSFKENKVYEHSRFGQLKIPVTVVHSDGFKGIDKKVKCLGHSTLSKFKDFTIAKNKTDGTLDLNLNTYKLPVGDHVLYLRSQVKGKYSRIPKVKLDAAKADQKKADEAAAAADKLAKAAATELTAAKAAATQTNTAKTAADQAVATAKTTQTNAQKAFDDADKAAKAAEVNSKKIADDTNKKPAEKQAAAKAATDKRNAATTAKAALDKAVAATKAAEAKVAATTKAAADTKTKQDAAQKKNDDLIAKKKTTDTAKAGAAAKVKSLTAAAKPNDITATFFSQPITVRVTEAPVELKPVAASQLNQGAKLECTVNLTRKYAFADPVTIGVALPKGTKGLTIGKLTIAKDQITGKFTITATDQATVGDLALNVEATLKLQNQTIKVTQPFKLKVIEVKKEANKK
ncbi:MAG: hypothetical protein H8E27_00670 [Verrucomicrobia subdivision 3 bacterium]|nr:hypothetical protein [Limisphaerales bacterium]